MAVITTKIDGKEYKADFAYLGDGSVDALFENMGEEWVYEQITTKEQARCRSCLAHWVRKGATQGELNKFAKDFKPGIRKTPAAKMADAIEKLSADEKAEVMALLQSQAEAKAA